LARPVGDRRRFGMGRPGAGGGDRTQRRSIRRRPWRRPARRYPARFRRLERRSHQQRRTGRAFNCVARRLLGRMVRRRRRSTAPQTQPGRTRAVTATVSNPAGTSLAAAPPPRRQVLSRILAPGFRACMGRLLPGRRHTVTIGQNHKVAERVTRHSDLSHRHKMSDDRELSP
jgi:hypothetical protein